MEQITSQHLRAGVIGLGQIGGGIAVSLQNRGFCPVVYDLRREAAASLRPEYIWAETPKAAAEQSDVVMLCVVNAEQIHSVLEGEIGLLAGARKGLILCIVSTISVSELRKIQACCLPYGVSCLDCGVTPGSLAAQNGMIAMVGGETADIQTALPVLNGWARETVRCGGLGSGMAVKLARNIVTYGGWRVVKEAQHLVEAAGVQPERLLTILENADPQGKMLLDRLRGNDSKGRVPEEIGTKILPLMKKDLTAACEMAAQMGVELPATRAALEASADTLDRVEPAQMRDASPQELGIAVADSVYGPGMGAHLAEAAEKQLYSRYTLEEIFGKLWARSGLSIHERRLLTMGVVAATGRADLIRVQALGALKTGEMTVEQLNEVALHLAYYAGWGNGGAVTRGISEAVKEFREG